MSLTAKQIEELNSAAARKEAGKASATDVQNLDYATKNFNYKYTPPVAEKQPISGAAQAYGAKASGTAGMLAAGTLGGAGLGSGGGGGSSWKGVGGSPAVISPMKEIVNPAVAATTDPAIEDYSTVTNPVQATEKINENQDAMIDAGVTDENPPTRGIQGVMNEINSSITPEGVYPEQDFTALLNQYRLQYGVYGLEEQLNELRAAEEEIVANKRIRSDAERDKTVAMNVIEGRVDTVERQENERLDAVQRQIKNITNQLNTKYDVINTLMQTEEMDYNNAVEKYDKQMEQNISMYNKASGIIEADKDERQQVIDTARSNAEIMMNGLKGVSYENISESSRTMLAKLGVQSGFGANFYLDVLKAGGGKEVYTSIKAPDDSSITFVYADGSTKVIQTGYNKNNSSSTAKNQVVKTPTNKVQTGATAGMGLGGVDITPKTDEQIINLDVKMATGADGKVNPVMMNQLRQDIAVNNPELLSWFDKTYVPKDMLNPTYYPYGVAENSWAAAINEDSAKNSLNTK